jgi:hypothetical protein
MRFLNWITRRLSGPRAKTLVIGIALLLSLPALWASFFIDEYVQAIHWRAGLEHFIDNGSGSAGTTFWHSLDPPEGWFCRADWDRDAATDVA